MPAGSFGHGHAGTDLHSQASSSSICRKILTHTKAKTQLCQGPELKCFWSTAGQIWSWSSLSDQGHITATSTNKLAAN
eukprot:1154050-Pelagomonas_calceolata.AAC.3